MEPDQSLSGRISILGEPTGKHTPGPLDTMMPLNIGVSQALDPLYACLTVEDSAYDCSTRLKRSRT